MEKPYSEEFYRQVTRLTFADFKERAKNDRLSRHEKIGFPNAYRSDLCTELIFADIFSKLGLTGHFQQNILDIGCGCDDLVLQMIQACEVGKHQLFLVDSQEMLNLLPDERFIHKEASQFPKNQEFIRQYANKMDAVLVYSVLQIVILEENVFSFIDQAVELLAPGGRLLLGDISNVSKRKRFFASPQGVRMHQEFTNSQAMPEVEPFKVEFEKIDDSIVFALLQRYRAAGLETYLLPQNAKLPMAGRREDILIVKPC